MTIIDYHVPPSNDKMIIKRGKKTKKTVWPTPARKAVPSNCPNINWLIYIRQIANVRSPPPATTSIYSFSDDGDGRATLAIEHSTDQFGKHWWSRVHVFIDLSLIFTIQINLKANYWKYILDTFPNGLLTMNGWTIACHSRHSAGPLQAIYTFNCDDLICLE